MCWRVPLLLDNAFEPTRHSRAVLGKLGLAFQEVCTYGTGGLGSKSTSLIVKMSSSGFEQKTSGFSPGTFRFSSSLIATWLPSSHEEWATEVRERRAKRADVSCILRTRIDWTKTRLELVERRRVARDRHSRKSRVC